MLAWLVLVLRATPLSTFFSDFFSVSPDVLEEEGLLNVSLINDLPLFIDPFLLFNSENEEYQQLHQAMIDYLVFLRDKAADGLADDGLLRAWYCFPEVKQNWLGFSVSGNGGTGLGIDFARALHANLAKVFKNFGEEQITESSHLEKVTLIAEGVGKDNISDFTTNLILDYLCRRTEVFALKHIDPRRLRQVSIQKAGFNFNTESWSPRTYRLPFIFSDHVVLTPRDMLTRDENWINRGDLIREFESIPPSIPNSALRAQVNNYFNNLLAVRPGRRRRARKSDREAAAAATIRQFPELIDYFIRFKELQGDKAADISSQKVLQTELLFIQHMRSLQ